MADKLKINTCTVAKDGTVTVEDSNVFKTQINPNNYKLSGKIIYNKDTKLGQSGQEVKFASVEGGSITIDIVLDGTGVVDAFGDDVKTRLMKLNEIVYNYDSKDHQPNYVRLVWGDLIFYGRLENMEVEYTLFKPNGSPLRAKVKLTFTSFVTCKEGALRANKSSPDMTHLVEVRAGDTLPQLCFKIYKDCSYYIKVAKVNNISNLKNLIPGTRIYFPPIR